MIASQARVAQTMNTSLPYITPGMSNSFKKGEHGARMALILELALWSGRIGRGEEGVHRLHHTGL